MRHVWEETEFGYACYGCGYFVHADEAKAPCTGQHYPAKLAQHDEQIAKLTASKSKILAFLEREGQPEPA